jgi:hypothetical protein
MSWLASAERPKDPEGVEPPEGEHGGEGGQFPERTEALVTAERDSGGQGRKTRGRRGGDQ